MAIKKCIECGEKVSTSAKQCPHCGADAPRPDGCLKQFLKIVGVGLILLIWMASFSKKSMTENSQAPVVTNPVTLEESNKIHDSQPNVGETSLRNIDSENKTLTNPEKQYSADEISKMEDEKQYHGNDPIVRDRLGLPPRIEQK